jgi:16S rRNA C967 or C1407 C5-methylase (RsmB/RsmF family)/NOL1/NOP2/fmu family ribosome biogenesis protein
MMFPEGFVQRIKSQGYIDSSCLLYALQEPSPVSIRINPSKWNKKPLDSDPVPWCNSGYYLEKRPSYTPDPLFHSGCYYPQEASGMFLEQVFKQIANTDVYIRVLDLCGAPGGKSTHLSSLIGFRGLLVSNEVIRSRAAILAQNIAKWGNSNIIVTQNDPSAFSELPGFFDVILVDAPCSGEGMFRDPVARNEWSEENTTHCSERQKRILSDVWPALRNNGILIYSTCTFNPGENESNIKWLTSKYPAETININTSDFKNITEIDHQGIKGYGFYPGRIKGEGLFISVIRKTGNPADAKVRSKRKYVNELKKPDLGIVKEWTAFPSENIVKAGEDIFSFPGMAEDFYNLQDCLKIIRKGIRICTSKKNNYVPAHELAVSDNIRSDAFPVAELDYGEAIAYLKRDNLLPGSIPKGWFIATYKGVKLGFCNNIGSRINNYFPVEWRIKIPVPETAGRNIINWDIN